MWSRDLGLPKIRSNGSIEMLRKDRKLMFACIPRGLAGATTITMQKRIIKLNRVDKDEPI